MLRIWFVFACAVALSSARKETRIHYGRTISQREVDTEFSFVVAIDVVVGRMLYKCTGSLVAPDIVVTAAHCVCHQFREMRVYIKATQNRRGSGRAVRVKHAEKNPKFPCQNRGNVAPVDVARLILEEPVHDAKPIPLDCRFPKAGEEVYMIGYGKDERGRSGRLKIGHRRTAPCHRYARGAICISARQHGIDRTDHGDSGGPLIVRSGRGMAQIGAVSGISGQDYTFFPVAAACDWIMGENGRGEHRRPAPGVVSPEGSCE